MSLQLTRVPERAKAKPPLVLAVLALGGPTERSALAHLLWEDSAHARSNLRVELHRLARGPFADAVNPTGTHVTVSPQLVSDVATARQRAAAGDTAGALDAAGPELLPWIEGAPGRLGEWLGAMRADWAAFYRETVHGAARRAEDSGDLGEARALARRASDLDPLSEDARREWLRLCVLLRDAPEARRVYAECEAMTRREFGRPPLVATRAWLEQLGEPGTAPAPARGLPRLPLVGRAELLRTLQGSAAFTLLVGDPGVGKSRLALEFARQSERTVVVPGAVTAGPLAAVAFTLEEVGAAALSAPSRAALAQLQDTAAVREFSAAARQELHAALAGALLEAAGPRGCVVFDDLHSLDAASLDVLGALVTRAAGRRQARRPALVGTARAFELQGSAADGWVRAQRSAGTLHAVTVPPLTGADVLALVQHLSAGAGGAQFAAALLQTTGGNPLFFLETLRALIGSGHVRVDDGGRWHVDFHAAGGYAHLPLPRSVQEAVLARADLLDGAARRVLDTLSIQGLPLGAAVLAQACGLDEWAVVEAVRTLEAAGFVHEVSAGLTLRHDLQREALRSALPGQRRGVLHAALATALADSGAAAQDVAQCFEAGGRTRDAARWWVHAGDHAQRAFAVPEAAQAYERAVALGLDDAEALSTTLKVFGIALNAVGDVPRARALLPALRGLQAASPLGDAEIALCEAQIHVLDAAYADTLAIAGRVLELDVPDALRATALSLRGTARFKLGQFTDAETDLRASRRLEPLDGTGRAFQGTATLVQLASQRGDRAAARSECDELLRLAGLLGDPKSLTHAQFISATLHAMAGEHALARRALEGVVELADRHGLALLGAQARSNLGGVLLADGQYRDALPLLAAARPHLPEQALPALLGNLAVCRFRLGHLGAALQTYAEVVELAQVRGEALLTVRRTATLLSMQVQCGLDVADVATQELLGRMAALGSGEYAFVAHCVAAQAALRRGETEHPSLAVLEGTEPAPDEREQHAYTLGWAALRRGDVDAVRRWADGAPPGALIAALRLLADPDAPDPGPAPEAAAVDALILAHARAARERPGAAAELTERLTALETSWPEHGGALRRRLAALSPLGAHAGAARSTVRT